MTVHLWATGMFFVRSGIPLMGIHQKAQMLHYPNTFPLWERLKKGLDQALIAFAALDQNPSSVVRGLHTEGGVWAADGMPADKKNIF